MRRNTPLTHFCRIVAASCLLTSCVPPGELIRPTLPSAGYGSPSQIRARHAQNAQAPFAQQARAYSPSAQQTIGFQSYEQAQAVPRRMSVDAAQLNFVNTQSDGQPSDMVSNMDGDPRAQVEPGFTMHRASQMMTRPYRGPLSLGEPGATASLFQDRGRLVSLYRDHRAFQPMDLLTIVVNESSQGTKEADTETSRESSILAGITNLFNFETDATAANTGLDTSTLVNADLESEFTGEGDTSRSGTLTARISAVVVEVLPNGVMRIEGERVISVNNEEQIMVISGLVRTRDVSSLNEVQSSNIANLRIDYFGRGMLGEVQYAGWFGRMLQVIWPF